MRLAASSKIEFQCCVYWLLFPNQSTSCQYVIDRCLQTPRINYITLWHCKSKPIKYFFNFLTFDFCISHTMPSGFRTLHWLLSVNLRILCEFLNTKKQMYQLVFRNCNRNSISKTNRPVLQFKFSIDLYTYLKSSYFFFRY